MLNPWIRPPKLVSCTATVHRKTTQSIFYLNEITQWPMATFFFSRRDYSSQKRDDLDEFNLVRR